MDENTNQQKIASYSEHDFKGYNTLVGNSLDDYDHVVEEAEYLLRNFETLCEDMKHIPVKNAILMDTLATIGLDL